MSCPVGTKRCVLFRLQSPCTIVRFVNPGHLSVACEDESVLCVNVHNGTVLQRGKWSLCVTLATSISGMHCDGRRIVTCGTDGAVVVWVQGYANKDLGDGD
eukprot:PhF_6_TR38093/c0_g1_i1/m.56823